jgi:hypothetical protein
MKKILYGIPERAEKILLQVILMLLLSAPHFSGAQSVDISLVSNPNVEFTFNTMNKLVNGIVIPNAITFDVTAVGTRWDLYVGSVTSTASIWDNAQYYTTSGNGLPPVGLLQMRVHNLSNTPRISGYVPIQDVATTNLDIIGNHLSNPDPAVNCSDPVHTGTNTPGSYLADPECYQFRVDLKITPGLNYRPGVYTMEIEFIIAADL